VALVGGGTVVLVVIYDHESAPGVRYTYTVGPRPVPSTSTLRPSEVEGEPIGYEWWVNGSIIKSCGDTSREYTKIFSDGFESGDFRAWMEVVDADL
jgi:hypothetical protein